MTPHPNDWFYTIGWTLVHFVWQGALIAIITTAVLAACRRGSSVVRYTVACIGLAALLAAPIGTLVVLRSTTDVPLAIENGLPVAGSHATASTGAALTIHTRSLALTAARTSAVVERWLPFVVWAWLFILSTCSYLVDYFGLQGHLRWSLIILFMVLKAGLIVAVFMHMAWERLALAYAILLPPALLLVFVGIMMFEADYTLLSRIVFFRAGA